MSRAILERLEQIANNVLHDGDVAGWMGIHDEDYNYIVSALREQLAEIAELEKLVLEARNQGYALREIEHANDRRLLDSYRHKNSEQHKEITRLLASNRTLQASYQQLVEALKRAEGYMFLACQPDKGDLFGEFDEKNREVLARIAEEKE